MTTIDRRELNQGWCLPYVSSTLNGVRDSTSNCSTKYRNYGKHPRARAEHQRWKREKIWNFYRTHPENTPGWGNNATIGPLFSEHEDGVRPRRNGPREIFRYLKPNIVLLLDSYLICDSTLTILKLASPFSPRFSPFLIPLLLHTPRLIRLIGMSSFVFNPSAAYSSFTFLLVATVG